MNSIRRLINLCEENTHLSHELQKIIEWASDQGVKLDAMIEFSNISIIDIERTTGKPGAGATVLQKLCDFADEHQLEMFLMVAGGNNNLINLYRGFGFDFDEQEEGDDETFADDENSIGYEPVMYRLPKLTI